MAHHAMLRDALPFAFVGLASLVPLIAIRYISLHTFDLARDTWLLGLAWFATFLVALTLSTPLALLGCVVLWHWRSWQELPSVATWLAIVATFALAQTFASTLREYLPLGWRVVALGLIVFACYQRWRGMEVKANLGGRILLAALLVLIWPFTSPIEWPLYALAFWLTSSWVALGGLAIAIAWRYPVAAPYVAIFGLVALVVLAIPALRRPILDLTPRGSSIKQGLMRGRTYLAMLRVTYRRPRLWLFGWGPNPASRVGDSLEQALAREALLLSERRGEPISLAVSPTHSEPLELVCAYGLVGLVALLWFAFDVARHLTLGDPWAASALGGAALSLATIPARAAPVGVVWLVVLAIVSCT
jgi:hypothetical protein